MDNIEEIAKNQYQQQLNTKRRYRLLKLLKEIQDGNIDSNNIPLDKLFSLWESTRQQVGGPRRDYVSPLDRSSYNYGYMTIPEMTANSPNAQ